MTIGDSHRINHDIFSIKTIEKYMTVRICGSHSINHDTYI